MELETKTKASEQEEDEDEDEEEKEKLVKVTTIVGPQADAIKEAISSGCCLTYRDDSVKGLTILNIYGEPSDYWSQETEWV